MAKESVPRGSRDIFYSGVLHEQVIEYVGEIVFIAISRTSVIPPTVIPLVLCNND